MTYPTEIKALFTQWDEENPRTECKGHLKQQFKILLKAKFEELGKTPPDDTTIKSNKRTAFDNMIEKQMIKARGITFQA